MCLLTWHAKNPGLFELTVACGPFVLARLGNISILVRFKNQDALTDQLY